MKKIAGLILILLTVLCGCNKGKTNNFENLEILSYSDVFQLEDVLEHDADSFTEGLSVYEGDLLESAGIKGKSKIIKYCGTSLDGAKEIKLDKDVFAEGSAVFNGTLYVLTWKERKAFLIDPETLCIKKTVDYNREGWGLTTDGEFLIASDGTDTLHYLDADLNTVKSVRVTYCGQSVTDINELEYDGRYIWANIWRKNICIAINPESGKVQTAVDFSEICPESTSADDVQNGIAYDGAYYYFTGKNWSVVYKMKLSNDSVL